MSRMSVQASRWARFLTVVVLAGAISVGVPIIRESILRGLGWALVIDEPVEAADIVVVAIDAVGAGLLDAADLVHSGFATRVAVFADPPDSVDQEFIRRGLPYEDTAARAARQLQSLGVTAIEQIPRVTGTEAEGQVLPDWCDQHRFRSVVVVTSRDHSRRVHRVLHRSMKGHHTRVMVRSTPYSTFDPDRWWETRGGIRTEFFELQKLLLDVLFHPMW
jgi:microcompartment protein CcmK/EutM